MKFLHTMLRVYDLEKSIEFYTHVFKLNIIRRRDFEDKKYTLVFLGYGEDESDIFLELTYNWETKKYDLGDGFGHIAFAAPELNRICEDVIIHGGAIRRHPGVLKTSKGDDVAFVTDPDGYVIEVIHHRQ